MPHTLASFNIGHFFAQRVAPEARIQCAIAQMVRVLDEHAEVRQRQNHIPQRAMQLCIVQRLRRGQL